MLNTPDFDTARWLDVIQPNLYDRCGRLAGLSDHHKAVHLAWSRTDRGMSSTRAKQPVGSIMPPERRMRSNIDPSPTPPRINYPFAVSGCRRH